jgi:hypothetical protein
MPIVITKYHNTALRDLDFKMKRSQLLTFYMHHPGLCRSLSFSVKTPMLLPQQMHLPVSSNAVENNPNRKASTRKIWSSQELPPTNEKPYPTTAESSTLI